MKPGCLEHLFRGHAFLAECWPDQHLVAHGPLERLGPLSALPELADLGLLLASYGDRVRVALPEKRDEHSCLQVEPSAAAALHGQGMALILNGVERFLPLVQDWLTALRTELGLPPGCEPRSIIYVTPKGAGNSPHFDANANFVVQVRGTKRWHLAPNTHVPDPTDRWAMNEGPLPEELRGYALTPLPTALPADAEVIDLKPGSVLFVPRGYWHSTEADEDTLALNFTFGQPTWADVALGALRALLLKDRAWRRLATGPTPSAGLLARLRDEVAALEGEPLYALVPEGFLRVEDEKVLASLGEDEFELDADERLHPVLAWIGAQGGPFSAEDVARQAPELSGALAELLAVLEAKGLLTRAAGSRPIE